MLTGGHVPLSPVGERSVGNPDGSAAKWTARVLLCFYREHLVALHGLIKKTRAPAGMRFETRGGRVLWFYQAAAMRSIVPEDPS